jgi:GNAT superfamily N-acetyltransferase
MHLEADAGDIRSPRPERPITETDVTHVAGEDDLRVAERIIVTGFTLDRFLPYQPGRAFPTGLLRHDGVGFFVIARDGEPAGACLTVTDGGAAGVYWVTTMPDQRSHGLGRRLMSAVLKRFEDVPVTLTASRVGKPLYDSLGFQTVAHSTWWS